MIIGIPDKLLIKWLRGKDYMVASDEGEAMGIAGGYYLATGKRATVFMSADGFCNALNPFTSWIIPFGIKMKLVISVGRIEKPHIVMTLYLKDILKTIYYDPKKISIKFIEKES